MERRFLKWILLLVCGAFAVACSKIDPEVRELLSAVKTPVVPAPDPDPDPETEPSVSWVEPLQGGGADGLSAGAVGAGFYQVRLEAGEDVALSAAKTPVRSYVVFWDRPGGEELANEGVLDDPSGFNP